MKKQALRKIATIASAAVSLLIILSAAGCQKVFTFSPVSFLQRPVSSLSAAQQISVGKDALASGDPAQMKAALEALLKDKTSAEAQYVASQLGVELSGVASVITGIVDGSITLPQTVSAAIDGTSSPSPQEISTSVNDFITQTGLQPEMLIQAAQAMQTAQSLGQELSPTDYAMGSLGLALQAAQVTTDGTTTYDFSTLTPAELAPAQALATQGVDALQTQGIPASDPSYQMLSSLGSVLTTLAP